VVAGASPVIEAADIAEIESLAPKIKITTVEGAGHMIPWDDLDGFLRAVSDFRI
ncbi:MAG: alpha/beta hydrolase, partial [Proteobacteria bacterium]|nr:alpha/beta hydrolase [Pseudomonadota bacterium]